MKTFITLAALTATAAATPAAAQESLSVALDWTPNTNHVGFYVAQGQGWYEDAGLDVEILPYTDTASSTLVANGVAEIGMLTSLGFYSQKAAGADLIALYAVMQHETGRVVFEAGRDDIESPADLDGKTYGGFGTNWEKALLRSMIREDGGEGDFETVTLGTAAYEALAAGRVDFTLEVTHWEGVEAELKGRKQESFTYATYGVPDQYGGYVATQQSWLEENGETARAFVEATARGYAFAAENPEEAAEILLEETNGMLTNEELVHASMSQIVERGLLTTDEGRVGVMRPEKVGRMGDFLMENDVLVNGEGDPLEERPDFASWVTNDYLPEQ